jgi:hypothetical protein
MCHDQVTLSPRLIVSVAGRKLKPLSATVWVEAEWAPPRALEGSSASEAMAARTAAPQKARRVLWLR